MCKTMHFLIVVACAALLGFATAVPMKEERRKPINQHEPKTEVPVIVELITERNNEEESSTEVPEIEEKSIENINADFSPINLASCFIGSVPKLIKCFKPKTTHMNWHFKTWDWTNIPLEDVPYIDEYVRWAEIWRNSNFWQTSAKLWLSGKQLWQPSEFWKIYKEILRSITGDGLSSEERWSDEAHWQSSQEDSHSSHEDSQPSSEYWQPGPDHWQPGPDYWQPGPDHWQPGPDYWQPGPDHWQPCCEEEQPKKDNSLEKERSKPKENHIAIEFSLNLPLVCIADAALDFGKCVLNEK